MRLVIVLSGLAVLALAAYYLLSNLIAIFSIPMGGIVVVLGLFTSRPLGVTVNGGQTGPAKMIVDRAVFGASIYQLAFFDSKLVLKRLASARTTIFSVLILALSGLFIDGIIGGLAGGLGGYAIQEYATQRNRQKIHRKNTIGILAVGDLEFPYADFKEVRLTTKRLFLVGRKGLSRISLPKGYAPKMSPSLHAILHARFKDEVSVASADTSNKQD